jgi:F-type H+-transporting ATPase subunit b
LIRAPCDARIRAASGTPTAPVGCVGHPGPISQQIVASRAYTVRRPRDSWYPPTASGAPAPGTASASSPPRAPSTASDGTAARDRDRKPDATIDRIEDRIRRNAGTIALRARTKREHASKRRAQTPNESTGTRNVKSLPSTRPARQRRSDARLGQRILSAIAFAAVAFALPATAAEELVLIPDAGFLGLLPGLGDGLGTLWIMLIGFVVLIFPLNALMFQPIFRALDERAERIQGARDRSTQLQSEADAVLDRYETAIREARSESESQRQGQLATAREEQAVLTTQARSDAEQELERARGELNRSLEEARATLRGSAEDLATAAAERILGRSLS